MWPTERGYTAMGPRLGRAPHSSLPQHTRRRSIDAELCSMDLSVEKSPDSANFAQPLEHSASSGSPGDLKPLMSYYSTTSGQSSNSHSSDAEATSPRQLPSSGYGSENRSTTQEKVKQQKKKHLQQGLRELKRLISLQCFNASNESGVGPPKVGTLEALNQALQLLKQNPKIIHQETSHVNDASSNTITNIPIDHSPLAADAAIFEASTEGINGMEENGDISFELAFPDCVITEASLQAQAFLGVSKEALVDKNFLDLLESADRALLMSCAWRACSFQTVRLSLFARIRADGNQKILCRVLCQLLPKTGATQKGTIICHPITSAYLVPKETHTKARFSTRHSVSCRFIFIDPNAVPFLGYLPQDLLGQSLLSHIHKDDISILQEAHEKIMTGRNATHRTKPYRFALQNGEFALIESEWTTFSTKWTSKVEFVVGYHRLVHGPKDQQDVFAAPNSGNAPDILPPEEILALERSLTDLLSKPIPQSKSKHSHKPNWSNSNRSSLTGGDFSKNVLLGATEHKPLSAVSPAVNTNRGINVSSNNQSHLPLRKRRQQLDGNQFVERLIQEIYAQGETKLPASGPGLGHVSSPEGSAGADEMSGSPPDSSGSGPLTYGEINYMENVERLLQSQLCTYSSDGSHDKNPAPDGPKSNSISPREISGPTAHQSDQTPLVLSNSLPRSHSAADVDTNRSPKPLTKEYVKEHTKKWEKECKETWKRRYSGEYTPTPNINDHAAANNPTLKRALEAAPYHMEDLFFPNKMFKSDVHRPASMPVMQRSQDLFASNLAAASNWPGIFSQKPMAPAEYYRSLGPNPPPPPGRNVQITSLPLGGVPPSCGPLGFGGSGPGPASMELSNLSKQSSGEGRKSAFVPLSNRKFPGPGDPGGQFLQEWQEQAINLSLQAAAAEGNVAGHAFAQPQSQQHRSVIQQHNPFQLPQQQMHHLGFPDSRSNGSWPESNNSSGQTSDHQSWQSAKSREGWIGAPLTEDLVLRYQQPRVQPSDREHILAHDQQRMREFPHQPSLINQQLEKVYADFQSTQISHASEVCLLQGSAVKEATDALMLLQET